MAGILDNDIIHCIDPRTGAPTVDVQQTNLADVRGVATRAREAQQHWAELGLAHRKKAIGEVHQAFLARGADVVALLAEEVGRPAGEAWTAEVIANSDLFAWWLKHIDDLLAATPLGLNPVSYPRKRGWVQLEAKGVIGLVTPWNLPVAIPLRAMVPALLAGNAVLWKPSEHSPRTAALLHSIFQPHVPDGLIGLVQGGGDRGAAVIDAGVDAVFFTGSERTGRKVHSQAAALGLPCALELGGKDAAVVMPDANLKRAVAGITWAAYGLAGQNCAAVERCFVHRSVYDSFVAAAVEATAKLRPLKDVGPLVNQSQLDIVKAHVAAAVDAGAHVAVGGTAPGPGYYHEPTVVTGVTDDMDLMSEETFGPVLPIAPFDDLDEVIRRVNGTRFGLTTSIWTADLDAGQALAGRFACGVVTVNNHAFTGALPDGTWGGVKSSGHGVTNSRFALYEMVRPRTVVVDGLSQSDNWWFPYNDALSGMASGLVELQRRGGNRLQGVRGAVTGLLNRWKADK
jgi:acyl-CoA reductase-like NAD-dependent aldehyde dehydrogenase